ncbi:Aminopeptidase N [Myotis davidii]|uniref:Aminopeptidase n=1 Tax=Myotis davidii TaxID=225400 RepID=L5LXA8_MYODS|nr:Aminopeptidase N [Myotis davidii]
MDQSKPWNRYRLPRSLVPDSYQVTLRPYLTTNQHGLYIFEGSSTVRFTCQEPTDVIIIHSKKLNYTDIQGHRVTLQAVGGAKAPEIDRTELVEVTEYLVVHLKGQLERGVMYEMNSKFQGELADDLAGFYRSEYMDGNDKKVLATTQMQSADARKSFPCFDEPAMKARFNITLIHPHNLTALSNMLPKGPSTPFPDDPTWHVTEFHTTPVMSTYLLAYIVSEFTYVNMTEAMSTNQNVLIRIWARPSATTAGHGQYALNVTGRILNFFAQHYNTSYPLDKSDQIGLPDFNAGAMENWGLVTYRENSLLFDPDSSSSSNKERVVTVIAHELAHQWFGNLVTVAWWNDLWLNEGFASYGASVIRMLSSFLTEDLFKKGLASYLQTFSYKSTTYLDLWEHLQKSYLQTFSYNSTTYLDLWEHLQKAVNQQTAITLPQTVKNIMDPWILQMGFPVITLNTKTGSISQKHFLLDPDSVVTRPSNFSYQWIVHISSLKNGVNYDLDNWKRIQAQLQNDLTVIPVLNRAQVIHDAFDLASARQVSVTLALDNTLFLIDEKEYLPWQAAVSSLSYFKLMFEGSEVYGSMQKYLKKQVTPLFRHFENVTNNWTKRPENLMDQYNEVNAISTACSSGVPECKTLASDLFSKWMADPNNNPIHPNLRSTIYCNAIAQGGEAEWDFAWEQFRKATLVNEADKLRAALACSKEVWILNRYLEYTLDPNLIRKQDATSTLSSIAGNIIGKTLAWDFVQINWKKLFNDYGGGSFSFSNLIQAVTRRFSTEHELQQLEQFKKNNMDTGFGSATRALEQALEKTKANIKWVKENKEVVHKWFQDHSN